MWSRNTKIRQIVRLFYVALSLFAAFCRPANAQSISNLNQQASSFQVIAHDYWVAQPFETGGDASAYSLSMVSLLLDTVGTPSQPMAVSIYSTSSGNVGSLVTDGLLSGAAYPVTGTDVWTPTTGSPVILAPSTEYWIVTSTQAPDPQPAPSASAYYSWGFITASSTNTDGWSAPQSFDYSQNQGATWTAFSSNPSTQSFSIVARAVPEPKAWMLFSMAVAVAGIGRFLRRSVTLGS